MQLWYNKRAVSDGRFRHHLFQAVFVRTTYPSRNVYFQVVKSPYSRRDRCYCYHCFVRILEPSEIVEIQVPVAHERRLLSRPDLHQIKDLILCFLKNLTWWGNIPTVVIPEGFLNLNYCSNTYQIQHSILSTTVFVSMMVQITLTTSEVEAWKWWKWGF